MTARKSRAVERAEREVVKRAMFMFCPNSLLKADLIVADRGGFYSQIAVACARLYLARLAARKPARGGKSKRRSK
jgi:hypothetical protein